MEERKVQLAVAVDASQAKQGLGEVKRSLSDLGATAAKAGSEAAAGLGGIGKGGDESAKKVDAATRSMAASIQRATALLEAGSRSSSKYFETLAAQRGVDVNSLRPYLDQLDAVAAKQKTVETALHATRPAMQQVEMSSKQMAHAMRQVPMQMTDIVTSLVSGQAPMTILVQQGGQLRDAFGGIGPAARAVGGYIGGLVNPFTVGAAAAAALAYAYHEASQEQATFAKALSTSGGVVGTTASQLQDMAYRIDDVIGTQRNASAVLAELAGTGRVAASNLEDFAVAAVRMEEGLGMAVSDTVKHFESLGKSPVEASLKLNEQYRYLTAAVYEQIKALDDQGRAEEAAAAAQKAFADEFERRAKLVSENQSLIERGWKAIKKGAAEAADEMLRAVRANSLSDELQNVEADIQAYNGWRVFGPSMDDLKARREAIKESMRLEQRAASTVADRVALETAAVAAVDAVTRANDKAKTKQEQLTAAIKDYRAQLDAIKAVNPESKLLDPNLIAKTEKAIADSFAEKKSGSKTGRTQLGIDIDAIRKASDELANSYSNAEKIMEARRAAGLISDKEYYESKRAFINLETQTKEDALKKEIAALEGSKAIGDEKLRNDARLASAVKDLAILRASSASKQEELNVKEAAGIEKVARSYDEARQAAQSYLDTIANQYQRELDGAGRGSLQRERDAYTNRTDDRYEAQRQALARDRRRGDISEEQYQSELELLRQYYADALRMDEAYWTRRLQIQGSWELGASEAVRNYTDFANNAFAQTEYLVGNAFKGMEDALVSFVKTGKLDFKSLADFMISEIIRIQVRSMIANAAGGGGWLSTLLKAGIGAFTGTSAGSTPLSTGGFSGPSYSAAGGFDIPSGVNPVTQLHQKEMVLPSQYAEVIRGMAKNSNGAAAGPMNLTIVNQTSAPIGKVTERQISPTEKAIIIEEAVQTMAASLDNPNSRPSKAISRNFNSPRSRS